MKKRLATFLFDTTAGDWLLRAFERLTSLAIVEIAEIEQQKWGAIALGRDSARVS